MGSLDVPEYEINATFDSERLTTMKNKKFEFYKFRIILTMEKKHFLKKSVKQFNNHKKNPLDSTKKIEHAITITCS